MGRRPKFLRFPYNHTGDTTEKHDAVAKFLAQRGYRLAPCTIDSSDYEFNVTYALAMQRHDAATAARAKTEYLAYTEAEIDWYAALNKRVLGHEPAEIMLLHDSPLNAAAMDEVLGLFERRGYRFVSLDEAEKDPAYGVPETYVTKYGPMWGYRWAMERGIKVDGRGEPEPPGWLARYVEEDAARRRG